MQRATEAWEKICSLGKFGAVPVNYAGGLDIGSLRNVIEDVRSGNYQRSNPRANEPGEPVYFTTPLVSEDDIKQVEDIAAGDVPSRSWKHGGANEPSRGDWK